MTATTCDHNERTVDDRCAHCSRTDDGHEPIDRELSDEQDERDVLATSLLRQPGESREPKPEPPRELLAGYGWCDLHHGNAWIIEPTANDPVTGIHGACQGCVNGRTPTPRLDPPPIFPSS